MSHATSDGAWLLGVIKPKKEIGEAEDRAGALVAATANGLGQGVIGAVGKRVAIDHEQGSSHGLGQRLRSQNRMLNTTLMMSDVASGM